MATTDTTTASHPATPTTTASTGAPRAPLTDQELARQRMQAFVNKIPPWARMIIRWATLYLIFQLVSRFALPYLMPGSPLIPGTNTTALAPPPGKEWPHRCAFYPGERLNLFLYLTYNNSAWDESTSQLVWKETGITYDWADSNTRELNISVPVDERLLRNESVTAQLFMVKAGSRIKGFKHTTSQNVFTYDLVSWAQKKKQKELHKLIGDSAASSTTNQSQSQEEESKAAASSTSSEYATSENNVEADAPNATTTTTTTAHEEPWLMYWHPTMEIRMLADAQVTPPGAMPDTIRSKIPVNFDLDLFWPVLYVNEFWAKHESLIIVNDTLKQLPLSLHYSPISLMKLTLYIQTEASLKAQASLSGGVVEDEMDEFRRILTETNPYFLGLTMIVSMVHSVFDFLAFKNDISFWRSRKSVAGLSVKTLTLNCFMQVVIFLYLLDNETSWLILISAGIGVLIEFWKIGKATKVSLVWKLKCIPWLKLTDRDSYTKSNTKVYDETAMRYLSYLLYPLVIGYAIYSLMYETHKSWYSWILGSLTGAVYTFGFIAMTPQLFINYKLKSVAHLPWRALIYKALNTVIDDLFAFIIKMPTLHRIACFRDDIIFLIYLGQRWKYPVDKKRLESISWEDAADDFADQQKAANEAKTAPAATVSTPATVAETKKDK